MKHLTLIAALMLGTTTLALAETKIINGCEVQKAENGNFYTLVDASCAVNGQNSATRAQNPAADPDPIGTAFGR